LKVPALIMAGGRGKRMSLPTEKPLLMFLGKPLLDWVEEAVADAESVCEFYVVTSANTPLTEEHCRSKGYKVIRTDAKGYHSDLKEATLKAGLMGPVLTIPADLPAVTSEFLDGAVGAFEVSGFDFLAVFVPIEKREALGLSVSSTDEYRGVWYAVSGVNIVNGAKIQGEGKIETSAIITDDLAVMLNINTVKDLQIAEQVMKESTNQCKSA
jgi:adenosylcobinamide-phosphate guanylyltransferase